MASIFQIGISRNTKCALKDGFRKSSHIYIYIYIYIYDIWICSIPGHLVPPYIYTENIIIDRKKGLESQTHDMYMMHTV